MKNISKKITLFLNDGLPKGVREISIDQWSGRAICGPRNKIEELIKNPGLSGPCIYFLIGDSEESDFLNVYVGLADPFTSRIKTHLRDMDKDWFQQVVIFWGSNNNPSRTGIEYLESKCYSELLLAAKCSLKNGNKPQLPSIHEYDIPGLEIFYENIALTMPLLGFDIFSPKIKEEINSAQYIYCKGKGAESKALLLDDGKVHVIKNSTAIKDNAPSFEKHNYKTIKDELLKIGRLVEKGEYLYFTEDYVFDSLSAAAAVVLARSAQGPKEWKYESGISVKDSIEK